MNHPEQAGCRKPASCYILDLLFCLGVALAILFAVSPGLRCVPGILFDGPMLILTTTAILLVAALIIGSRNSSPFGTPLLNNYLKLTYILTIVTAILISPIQRAAISAISPPWLAPWAEGLVVLLGACLTLALLRGISSAIRRQAKYPVLTGCSFLFVGDPGQGMTQSEALFPGRHKKGIRVFYYTPDGRKDDEMNEFQWLLEGEFIEKAVFLNPAEQQDYIERCRRQGIEIWLHTSGTGADAFVIEKPTSTRVLLKFTFDRLAAMALIALSSPVWLVAAIGIKCSDRGPVFFRQSRSGLYGKHFGMWKFRTMSAGADKRLDEVKAEFGNEMSGPIFKLGPDPRIFPFGKILRKLSIDEIPQLLNVLLGDMSMVGPRPLPVYETEAFEKIEHRRRLCVLPGLTCYWQIEGRSNITDFEELIALDQKYIDRHNVWIDTLLLLRTVPAVLFARGAK